MKATCGWLGLVRDIPDTADSRVWVSPHVTREHLKDHRRNRPYPDGWDDRLTTLLSIYENFRAYNDHPDLQIIAAFKSLRLTRLPHYGQMAHLNITGVMHYHGQALDIISPRQDIDEFHTACVKYALNDPRVSFTLNEWGVHMDTRPRTKGQNFRVFNSTGRAGIRIRDIMNK